MFRDMRRNRQQLPQEECLAILERGTCGVLALSGDGGYPYAVPISYVYDNGKIYFHSAVSGHKIDALSRNNKASFCVVDQDRIVPEKYTTCFRSVIAFGKLRILSEPATKRSAIEKLALKYAPADSASNRGQTIEQSWEAFCMLEMTVEHITGKAARELLYDQPSQ